MGWKGVEIFMNKISWIAIVSWMALLGMWLSIIFLNLIHAIIIGFIAFSIWLFNMVVVIFLAIRDGIRICKENKSKRRSK